MYIKCISAKYGVLLASDVNSIVIGFWCMCFVVSSCVVKI